MIVAASAVRYGCNKCIVKEDIIKMRWKIIIFILIAATNFYNEAFSETEDQKINKAPSIEDILKEANQNFTYNGKTIHPGCVEQFMVNLADAGPPIVRSVDVESCISSNEFFMDYDVSEDGYIGYEYEKSGEKSYFGYKIIGKAKGGIHILDTRASGGGTMVAMTVFLTRFSIENYRAFDEQEKLKIDKRLILKCIGQIERGDRDIGSIELINNNIILGESQYRKKVEVISLD